MRLFSDLNEWISFRNTLSNTNELGFVPTMGNLHQGHASLFQRSVKENQLTVSSLFINPTQFNNPEDFTLYPRTLDADLQILSDAGVDFCLLPDEKSMYAEGYNYQIHENKLCQLMEGAHRPGHFNGVLTVVMKLLQLTKPNRAYFGEKDYQQLLLIKGMVSAFFMDVSIVACKTVREASGLAYSSRNTRLSTSERLLADTFAKIFHQPKPCAVLIDELKNKGIGVEYIEEYQGRRFAAVTIGKVRLIDNYLI